MKTEKKMNIEEILGIFLETVMVFRMLKNADNPEFPKKLHFDSDTKAASDFKNLVNDLGGQEEAMRLIALTGLKRIDQRAFCIIVFLLMKSNVLIFDEEAMKNPENAKIIDNMTKNFEETWPN